MDENKNSSWILQLFGEDMKKIVLYFDPAATQILVEKTDESGEKKKVLSSPKNFVSAAEIVARVIEIDNDDQIQQRIDPDYDYYNIADYVPVKSGDGIYIFAIHRSCR